ncbi:MAG: purine-binding chemotaxis protein CheW [Ignavibacterium sp.]|jgi:purine-binding chemotaxis protein CheW
MNGKSDKESSPQSQTIDWDSVHQRLRAIQERLDGNWSPPPEKVAEILRTRAEALAREPEEEETGESLEVLEFSLAYERYGLETMFVREVYLLKELTPLPGTPPFVLGIINVRGKILSVLDLKKFFDLPEKGLTDLNRVIVLSSDTMEFGVLADEIIGVRSILTAALQPAVPTMTGIREEYLRGLSPDGTVVLDAATILNDKNIIVFQEVDGG